jgi:hypothetical protein
MIKFFGRIRHQLLTDNKATKYLLYAIGEIVLVVIGILIALQINNWNEGRKAAKQENLYLSRLLSENKQDLITFSSNIDDLEKGMHTIVKLSEALKNESLSDRELIQSANDYFEYGSIYPIFTSSTSTFDDLSSTGNLQLITNSDLRESIVKHYARHKQIAERIQIAIDWALPLDSPFTFENDIMKFEPSTAFLYPETSEKILCKELRDNKLVYISNAAAHYWINKDCILQLQGLMKETSKLISQLEK